METREAVVAYRLERAQEALEDLSSSKHTGIRGLFNLSFVRTGRFPKSLARTYNDLFAHRQESDYIDFVEFEELQVREWLGRPKRSSSRLCP